MNDILIVDDRAENLEMMRDILESEDYQVRVAEDADTALFELGERVPNLVLLDLWLRESKLGGLDILDHVCQHYPGTVTVMISAHGNIETAVQAMEKGAINFVEKPVAKKQLLEVVRRALEVNQLRRENAAFRERESRSVRLLGESRTMRTLRRRLESAARSNSRILFRGPPGVGKQEAARYVHMHSNRSDGPFVVVGLSEIATHTAIGQRNPLAELLSRADGGTMFLDEVGDLPPDFQSDLLRALTDQTLASSGEGGRRRFDARVLSATVHDAQKMLAGQVIREDLYHRLAVLEFDLPPLTHRKRDIPDLVDHFMQLLSGEFARPAREVGAQIIKVFKAHTWPGNVRELRNIVERLVVSDEARSGQPVEMAELPLELLESDEIILSDTDELVKMPLRDARAEFERNYFRALIQRFEGKVSDMAEIAEMSRTALHRKLNDLGLVAEARHPTTVPGNQRGRGTPGNGRLPL